MTSDVDVTIHVSVTVDKKKFTPEFMKEFREYFYPFHTVDDHISHLAFLAATGQIGDLPRFIEGYGHSEEFGIKIEIGR